jgi:hypothetical protein
VDKSFTGELSRAHPSQCSGRRNVWNFPCRYARRPDSEKGKRQKSRGWEEAPTESVSGAMGEGVPCTPAPPRQAQREHRQRTARVQQKECPVPASGRHSLMWPRASNAAELAVCYEVETEDAEPSAAGTLERFKACTSSSWQSILQTRA